MAVSLKKIQKWGEKKQTNKLVDIIYLCYDNDIRNVIKEAFLKIGIDSVKPIITHFDENYGDAFIQASCLNILSVFSNPNIIELAVKAVLLPNKEIRKEALNIFFYNQKYSIRYFNDTFKSQEVSTKFKTRCLKALHIIYKVKDCSKSLRNKILDVFDLASESANDQLKKEFIKILKTIKTDKSKAIITFLNNS